MADDYQEWIEELAARRPFGDGDRVGTANWIDAAARLRGASSVETGTALSLARPLQNHDSARGDGRPGFAVETYYSDGPIGMGSDHLELDCHGVVNTHLDALNHIALHRTWYGGFAVDDPDAPNVKDLAEHGLFTRGILLDIPRLRGSEWADPERPVGADDFDGALEAAGVDFESGDALIVYMGRDRWERSGKDMVGARGREAIPGIGRSGAEWIAEHAVSLLCWDFLDAYHDSQPAACVHLLNWAIGLVLVDNCDLGTVAERLRSEGRATGGLVVAPLAVPGATGCTVRPLLLV